MTRPDILGSLSHGLFRSRYLMISVRQWDWRTGFASIGVFSSWANGPWLRRVIATRIQPPRDIIGRVLTRVSKVVSSFYILDIYKLVFWFC
jgi:hypothetical protein